MDEEDTLDSEHSIQEWADAVAAATSTPAGGAVAALATALAASLVAMVAGLTMHREKYAAVHDHARETLRRAEQLRRDLLDMATLDAAAVAEYMDALSLPQGTEFERTAREAAKRTALIEAARIQLELLHQASEVADLAEAMAGSGLATAIGDAASAGLLAAATGRSAYWSIRSNLKAARWPEEARPLIDSAWVALEQVEASELRVQQLLEDRVG
ncbi:MAG: cyclodeaminase/cyclohydrolase family protein [Gemmatimonadales bacterium]|nr:cyclodeaminase/cyclohydrolase family protein [Gemmatimonadales bacterium]